MMMHLLRTTQPTWIDRCVDPFIWALATIGSGVVGLFIALLMLLDLMFKFICTAALVIGGWYGNGRQMHCGPDDNLPPSPFDMTA